jgi:hypothetical protein
MDLQNEIAIAEDRVQLSVAHIEGMEKLVANEKEKIAKLKGQIKSDKYNPQLEDQLTGQIHQLERYEGELASKKLEQKDAKQTLVQAGTAKREYTAKLGQVFHVRELGVNKDGKFTIGLEYLTECSKYQYLCPLPEKQRKALRNVLSKEKLPESCLSYSEIVEGAND